MPLRARPDQDVRVRTVITHWAARFLANGVPLDDVEAVSVGTGRWDEWCQNWSQRGASHEALGRAAASSLSAAEHFIHAALCFHFGKFLFVHLPEEMREAHSKAVACRLHALAGSRPPGERVEIPFEGASLAGILRLPEGIRRPPVVLMVMGLDSAKEEMDSYEATFLARGLATFSFDGPGQGESEYQFPARPDYEAAVSAVIDYLTQQRDDLDRARIGLWGVSLGGYYAARAAAFDKRIQACVSLSGPYDLLESWAELPDLTKEVFRVRSHLATASQARDYAAEFSLKGIAEQITCPLLVVFGTRDRLFPQSGQQRLIREATGPAEVLMVDGGNHVANNRWYLYRPQSADWLAGHLGSVSDDAVAAPSVR